MDDDAQPMTRRQAERAAEGMRALAHLTLGQPAPAPEVFALLGETGLMLVRTSDVLRNLGNGVRMSLTTHHLVEDDGSDPGRNTVRAQALLQQAASLIAEATQQLWDAQTTLAGQGHNGTRASGEEIAF